MELQTRKVNNTVALMKYINFYDERTLFDTPNIDKFIDFYTDNKLSNHKNEIWKSLLQNTLHGKSGMDLAITSFS